jgi:UDP-N-acetylglucosamine 4,6-dehydratase
MILDKKPILITGGTGSFGKTMLSALLEKEEVSEVRIFSRDEEKQDSLRNDLRDPRVKFFIGDVRDRESVDRAMYGAGSVFHAAALKQVPSCEFFPLEALRTNVLGSENVVRSAIAAHVRSIVCLSTDKAVFPINTMGITKALMEKTAQAAAREIGVAGETTISCVRYGNVMCSRGSVIPLFVKQIKAGRPLTITEPTMTRFLMPLRDSVSLVLFAFERACQGDIFVKKAGASTISDLADALRRLFGMPDYPIEIIGWRHSEKLYETLASAQELAQAEDLGDFLRVTVDRRDLNYGAYTTEGRSNLLSVEDYHSHNARRLNVQEVMSLLETLPEMQEELALYKARQ